MSSKDKESKTLRHKMKDFFKNYTQHTDSRAGISGSKEKTLTEDCFKDLSRTSQLPTRLKRLKELCETISTCKLKTNDVERLWSAIEDLFGKEHSTDTRHLAFAFLQCLVKDQSDKLNIMRAQFFRLIKQHDHPEDVGQRLELLVCLTNNGRDMLHFEEEVGPFLLNWLQDISKAGKIQEYLSMVDNVIKFNTAYLNEEVISGFIQHICVLCCSTTNYDTVKSCLQIMTSVVAYSNMSPESLPRFIGALCRTVNVERYCTDSWQIMKTLMGTDMGHSALYTMCKILQERALRNDVDLLRGAVFYIYMSLWGQQALTTLHCPPSSVLPSFLQAVTINHPGVSYEVILGVYHLVNKHRHELQDSAWSILFEILSHAIKQIDAAPNQVPNNLMVTPLHDSLNIIENLITKGHFNGSVKQFYSLIEECYSSRPESSTLKLVAFLAESIVPTEHLWLTNLYNLLHKYFKPDVRTNVRLKVLDVLSNVVKLNRLQYEDEIIDGIIIPNMINIVHDPDIVVRQSVANLLVELCMDCQSRKCLDLLDILDKLLRRPFESLLETPPGSDMMDFCDIKSLVSGLIDVFVVKIHKLPSSHAIKIYQMLVKFLELHYKRPKLFENCNQIRLMIFNCFLKMRADHLYRLGCPTNQNIMKYSSYLCVTYQGNGERAPLGSPPPQSPAISQQPCNITYVPLHRVFKVFLTCLKSEKDWEVLSLILTEMPKVLQNKSLILSKHGNNELDLLVAVLCAMITDRSLNLPESLNVKVSKPDFHSMVLLVLVCMASYHSYVDPRHQDLMICCFEKCLQSGPSCSKHCISALMICTLEMREVMVKKLQNVLLTLSKISATIHIAIPVLEFLSTLTQLPLVFANFVARQYMAVFAIALPFTNPFKYNHFIVSLAHHVIAVWFLKCRVPFRKDFVKFISKGLQTNVLIPFEETSTVLKVDLGYLASLNQDSSDRKRSSSLTEQGPRRRAATISARMENKSTTYIPPPPTSVDKSLITFYEELTETCMDLMARYAFSPCSALPRRLPTAEFLLNGGQSMCWVLGNKLVTVTTSGCSQKVLKHGLCDKCWTLCLKTPAKTTRSGSNDNQESTWATRQNSNDKSNNNTSASSPIDESKKMGDKLDTLSSKLQQLVGPDGKNEKQTCACWCQEWSEIYVRRPTGDMSWVMRIQNSITYQHNQYEFPLNEVSTIYMPSLVLDQDQTNSSLCRQATSEDVEEDASGPASPKNSPSRQNSRDSTAEEDQDNLSEDGKSRNPVRRSNSSPEMSANWKNPFMQKMDKEAGGSEEKGEEESGKKGKMYSKDTRVSCEAIPEEMAGSGTTPPSTDHFQLQNPPNAQAPAHPSLLSCHSYPGSSPPKEPSSAKSKPYQTVPVSPNVLTTAPHTDLMRSFSLKGERPSNLLLSSKPPQSPTQTSPRLSRLFSNKDKEGHEIQKSSSSSVIERNTNANLNLAREVARDRKNSGSIERSISLDPNQAQKRDRVHTISVMSRKPRPEQIRQPNTRSKEAPKSGISPSFVFLQLYHAAYFGNNDNDRPLLVGSSDVVQRAVKVLDHIPPYETHKIGVLYVREGQSNNEAEILRNKFGSLRYVDFLQNLGTLVKLSDVDPQVVFLGGLDQSGGDGKFAYIWKDDVIRVAFHVATMMPNKDSDLNCTNKKLHIGNNYVTIVYNESGEDFNINTIKGQFNFAAIIIHPLDHNTNRVTVKVKEDLNEFMKVSEAKIVSDQNVAILAKQLALHANLASLVASSLKRSADPYASNFLERLRKIKNVRNKIMQVEKEEEDAYRPDEVNKKRQMEDFTVYT